MAILNRLARIGGLLLHRYLGRTTAALEATLGFAEDQAGDVPAADPFPQPAIRGLVTWPHALQAARAAGYTHFRRARITDGEHTMLERPSAIGPIRRKLARMRGYEDDFSHPSERLGFPFIDTVCSDGPWAGQVLATYELFRWSFSEACIRRLRLKRNRRPELLASIESSVEGEVGPPVITVRLRLAEGLTRAARVPNASAPEALLGVLTEFVAGLEKPTTILLGLDDPTLERLLGRGTDPPAWLRRANEALRAAMARGDVRISISHLTLGDSVAPSPVGLG